jgi:hypothetical protein
MYSCMTFGMRGDCGASRVVIGKAGVCVTLALQLAELAGRNDTDL